MIKCENSVNSKRPLVSHFQFFGDSAHKRSLPMPLMSSSFTTNVTAAISTFCLHFPTRALPRPLLTNIFEEAARQPLCTPRTILRWNVAIGDGFSNYRLCCLYDSDASAPEERCLIDLLNSPLLQVFMLLISQVTVVVTLHVVRRLLTTQPGEHFTNWVLWFVEVPRFRTTERRHQLLLLDTELSL